MNNDDGREYLAKKVNARGGLGAAAAYWGINYNTLASILNGNRPMGERTLQKMVIADPRLNVHKLRAIKTYRGQPA